MSVTVTGDGPNIELTGTGSDITITVTTGSGGGGGGVTDHGLLTGLGDDDHTQYAQKANNLSDLADAATARTNLGLGSAATQASSAFDAAGTAAALVDDLSGVSDQATARTNLGLGSAAVAATGDFATAAQGAKADTAVQPTIVDAKGDLLVATAADTVARLPVGGTNGHVLTVNSATASGVEWAAAAGGGATQAGFPTLSGGIDADNWSQPPGVVATGNLGITAFSTGTAWVVPFEIADAITVTAAAVRCTTGAAGGIARAAIVALDTTLQPTDLVHEFATFDCSTTGVKSQTGLSVALPAGLYATYIKVEVAGVSLAVAGSIIAPLINGVYPTFSSGGSMARMGFVSIADGAYADPPAGMSSFSASSFSPFFMRWTA